MTDSATTTPREQRVAQRSNNPVRSLLVLLFRLLLLGVGGSLAWLLGVAIAELSPAEVQDPPLMERAIRQIESVHDSVRQPFRQTVAPIEAEPQPVTTTEASPSALSNPSPAPSLSAEERQALETEAQQLQTELSQLRDRTQQIESQLGNSAETAASLEDRLQTIQYQLNPASGSAPQPSEAILPAPNLATTSYGNNRELMVTLPSDALFDKGQSALRSDSNQLLNSIAEDLRQYPGATIQVAAHVDPQPSTAGAINLSFEQAQAIAQQLSQQLGEDYHWMALGYGSSRPIVENETEPQQQRNRRIEITIDPK